MGAEDSFVVHFRMRSGAVGVMQSTAADWGRLLVETRITGSTGTAWIDGLSSTVQIADGSGTRQATVGRDLLAEPARPTPLPDGFSRTAYEQMIAHGLDFPAYARLGRCVSRPDSRPAHVGRSPAGDLRRRRRRHGGARRHSRVRVHGPLGKRPPVLAGQ